MSCAVQRLRTPSWIVHFIMTGHIGDAALDSVVLSGWELAERELGACTILHVAQGLARTNGRDPL